MLRIHHVLLVLTVVFLLLTGGAAMCETDTAETRLIPVVKLDVNGYEMTCSIDLADEIIWAADENTPQADLVFSAKLRDGLTVPVFTMQMMQDQADQVMLLANPSGPDVPVGFELADVPEGLTPEETQAFSQAQMEVYVLLASLELRAVPQAVVLTEDPAAKLIWIEMEQYRLAFPVRYAEQLQVSEENGALVFRTAIGSGTYTVFTLHYNSSEGDLLIIRKNADGSRIPFAFVMAQPPEHLDAEERRLFHAAQGVVNEIISTIALR